MDGIKRRRRKTKEAFEEECRPVQALDYVMKTKEY
jgi:hypothetical protein